MRREHLFLPSDNGNPSSVRARLQEALDGGAQVLVSTVVAFELWYGVATRALVRKQTQGGLRLSS